MLGRKRKDGCIKRVERKKTSAVSLHPSGIMIKDERKVMDDRSGFSVGRDKPEDAL